MTRPEPSRTSRTFSASSAVRAVLAASALALALPACGGSAADPAADQQPSYLFNVTAGQSLYQHGKLLLLDVSRMTNAFTDRPARATSLLSTRDFSHQFDDLFAGDPPNADYTGVDFKADRLTGAVLELTNPDYDDEVDTLTYDAKQIGDITPPRLLSDVAVTIDDAGNYSPAENAIEPAPDQPANPESSAPLPSGARVIYDQAPESPEEYPAPAPVDHYPICRPGQFTGCMEPGNRG